MTRQTKIVIAALVVITAMFAGSAAQRPGGGSLKEPGALVEWFGAKFAKTPDADPADLSAPCRSGDTFVVRDGSCVLRVAARQGRRTVRLRADSDVGVQAPAPGQDTLVRSDAKAGDTVSVTVGDAATDIDLICAGERTCVLTIAKKG
ncbi:hypothetical protein GCM10009827_045480 [Dactylosporangium maewongense]|uniref:DUF5666 domain-containing protein n=1 Tax=Dactylosporangium maewongense TaxID=634393 RepID=A0ABP4LHB3_9ACTN